MIQVMGNSANMSTGHMLQVLLGQLVTIVEG